MAQNIADDLQISPAGAKARLERGDGVLLVDVREPWETQLGGREGAILMPWAWYRTA